jgi:hypothetical protein
LVKRLLQGSSPAPATSRRWLKDKSLRPIACGDVWRRLAARCACKDFADRFRESLAPHQFGVAVPGGTEILVHAFSLRRVSIKVGLLRPEVRL